MNSIDRALTDRDVATLAKMPGVSPHIKTAARGILRWTGTSNRSTLAVGILAREDCLWR